MAADEYLISWHRRTGVPVMRMYAWGPPAISLGRYQPIDSVNLEACRAGGVDVVRRITGGGAIFHDREVTYSLVCAGDDLDDTPWDVPESFEIMNRFLIVFYRWLGFHAVYAKDTSLKNISGSRAAFCFSSNEKYDDGEICAFFGRIGFRQRLQHFINQTLSCRWVLAFDVSTQDGRRHGYNRVRREHEAQRHAVKIGVFPDNTFKRDCGKGRGGNSVFKFQGAATSGDRRDAARSAGHAENDRIALLLDFLPKIGGVVSEDKSRLASSGPFLRSACGRQTTPETAP